MKTSPRRRSLSRRVLRGVGAAMDEKVPQSRPKKDFFLEVTLPDSEERAEAVADFLERSDVDVFNPSGRAGATVVALVGEERAVNLCKITTRAHLDYVTQPYDMGHMTF